MFNIHRKSGLIRADSTRDNDILSVSIQPLINAIGSERKKIGLKDSIIF